MMMMKPSPFYLPSHLETFYIGVVTWVITPSSFLPPFSLLILAPTDVRRRLVELSQIERQERHQ